MYMQLEPEESEKQLASGGDLNKESEDYFKAKGVDHPDRAAFLDTEEGMVYRCLFERLRLQHIINDTRNTKCVFVLVLSLSSLLPSPSLSLSRSLCVYRPQQEV